MATPPAGWYPDPQNPNQQRYWDGTAWGDDRRALQPANAETLPPPVAPKKKRRIFLWVFLAVQVLFIVWIIAGAGSGDPSDCGSLDAKTCEDATNVGTGIGIVLIVILWMVVDFFMALIYGVYRLAKRA